MLAENRYGKSGIRLLKRTRRGDRNEIRDLTVDVSLEGDFTAAHVSGDNSAVLPTDTMKNSVYALARKHPIDSIEAFALELAAHFLRESEAAFSATVSVSEAAWARLPAAGGEHPSAFRLPGGECRTARVRKDRDGSQRVEAGIAGLTILKAAHSGFSGFPRGAWTTLPETEDRILATSLEASWTYATARMSWDVFARAIRSTLLDTFAAHVSASVQHTLNAMGEAALDAHGEVAEIRLTMPNRHHIPVDLSPFGLENPGEIFVPTEEPYGRIEATFRRPEAARR